MFKKIKELIEAIELNEEFFENNQNKIIVKIQYFSEELEKLLSANLKSESFLKLLSIIEEKKELTSGTVNQMYFIRKEDYDYLLKELEKEAFFLKEQQAEKSFKAFYHLKDTKREVFVGSKLDAIELLHSFCSEYYLDKSSLNLDFKDTLDKFNSLITGELSFFDYAPYNDKCRYIIKFWCDNESEENFNKRILESEKEILDSLLN
jgi:hypothetical protein